MKRTDDIERRIQEISVPDPPEGLAERIIEEIPEDLEADRNAAFRPRGGIRYQWWAAAAAVLVLALTGVVTWKMGPTGPTEKTLRPIRVRPQQLSAPVPTPREERPAQPAANPSDSRVPVGQGHEAGDVQPVKPARPARPVAQPTPAAVSRAAGELTFQVVDEGKQPLPGVTVVLSSPGKPHEQSKMTDAEGKVSVKDLEPGRYRADVSLPGYQTVERRNLEVGKKNESVDVTLKSAFAEEVVVSGEAPLVDTRKTTLGKNQPQTFYADLPAARKYGSTGAENAYQVSPSTGSTTEPAPQQNYTIWTPMDNPAPAPPSTGGTTEPNDQPYGDVFFSSAGVNPFVDTEDDRLSTFGLDVDTGSYTITRRYLHDGHLPPPSAIRVEEFINAFDYGDPAPRRDDFRLSAEGAPDPFGDRERSYLLRFGIAAREVDASARPPALLIFTVDVSGSMARENRLGLVKRALEALLDQLRPDDRVGLVVYGSQGRVLLEPTHDHEAIREAIDRLRPGGSTNAEEGLVLAYRMAEQYRDGSEESEASRKSIVRVILCSDGVANVGRTGADSILERIRQDAAKGVELTTVGFGMGNYNDTLMERLADTGDGRYAYVDDFEEAHRIFVEELTGTLLTIAHDARSQVEFDPKTVERWRLLGYENRDIADNRFRDPTVDAGEVGAGQTVTALYEVKLKPRIPGHRLVATLRLRYRPTGREDFVEIERRLRARDLARSWDDASSRLQLASVVGEFAEILKHSFWAKHDTLGEVLSHLDRLRGHLAGDPRVQELGDMIRQARDLQKNQPAKE